MVRSLPLAMWPSDDRRAWTAACRPDVRLQQGGRAGHLKPGTRADLARRYGYFLQALHEAGRLNVTAAAGTQVTPEAIETFLACARPRWSSVTLSQSVFKVRRMAELLAPQLNFDWLGNIEANLRFRARPRSKYDRLVHSATLVEAGLTLAQQGELSQHLRPRERARLVRDGLMVALLALCPIRLGSLASLTVGETFQKVGARWWIVLGAEHTKSGKPDQRPMPELLDGALTSYLERHRPVLLGSLEQGVSVGPLWVSVTGGRLTYSAVHVAVMRTTRVTIGTAVNPHAFRMAAATTAAYEAGDTPHLGSAMLDHEDPRTTEASYRRTRSIQASLVFGKLLRRRKSKSQVPDQIGEQEYAPNT